MKICLKKLLNRDNRIYFVLGLLVLGELLSVTYSYYQITGKQFIWVADDSSSSLKGFCKMKFLRIQIVLNFFIHLCFFLGWR